MSRARTALARPATVDVVALSLLLVIALVGFRPVYGGVQYVVTGLAAMAFGMLIAVAAVRRAWGPLGIALAIVAVHLVLGSAFAAPSRARWGILPTVGSVRELLVAPVRAWKITLTMAPPVGVAQGVLVVVWLSVLVLSTVAYVVALRARRAPLAVLSPLALLALTVLMGTTAATWPIARGAAFAVIALGWLSWRQEAARLRSARSTLIAETDGPLSWRDPLVRRRVIGGTVVLAVASLAAVAAGPVLEPPAGSVRYALRDRIVPPFDPLDYTSPLAQFRGYVKNRGQTTLFTVSGVRAGERVRLATLDAYDGTAFLVAGGADQDSASGAFLRTAADVDLGDGARGSARATFTIDTAPTVWMPSVGSRTTRVTPRGAGAAGIAENLYVNQASQTLVDRAGLRRGDAYTLTYVPYREPSASQQQRLRFATTELPALPRLDPKLRARAQEYMGGARTDFSRMQNLTAAIRSQAFFTHGLEGETPSLSGHGEFRLLSMLEETGFDQDDAAASPTGLIGDQEQLAALTAVLARSAGIPARVVMGFTVPQGTGDDAIAVTGKDVTAWVEVDFEGVGWVRFDPTPEDRKDPTQPEETVVDQPKPQVAQPPPPPAEPPSLPPAMSGTSGDDADPPRASAPAWVLATLGIASPFLLVALLLLAVVAAKALRRRRRRSAGVGHERIAGGWAEILDRATDLGVRTPRRATRRETGVTLGTAYPQLGLEDLAARADRSVFGPEDATAELAETYWRDVDGARRAMGAGMGRVRRVRAAISLRSLAPRRYTRRARSLRRERRKGEGGTRKEADLS